jgi:hypothetical protein
MEAFAEDENKKGCIINMLAEIKEIVEYPRSDREQHIKCAVDLVLQDVKYLSNDIKESDK